MTLCGTSFSKSTVSRLVTALCVEQSEEWLAGRVYLDMSKLDAADAGTVTAEEGVTSMAA